MVKSINFISFKKKNNFLELSVFKNKNLEYKFNRFINKKLSVFRMLSIIALISSLVLNNAVHILTFKFIHLWILPVTFLTTIICFVFVILSVKSNNTLVIEFYKSIYLHAFYLMFLINYFYFERNYNRILNVINFFLLIISNYFYFCFNYRYLSNESYNKLAIATNKHFFIFTIYGILTIFFEMYNQEDRVQYTVYIIVVLFFFFTIGTMYFKYFIHGLFQKIFINSSKQKLNFNYFSSFLNSLNKGIVSIKDDKVIFTNNRFYQNFYNYVKYKNTFNIEEKRNFNSYLNINNEEIINNFNNDCNIIDDLNLKNNFNSRTKLKYNSEKNNILLKSNSKKVPLNNYENIKTMSFKFFSKNYFNIFNKSKNKKKLKKTKINKFTKEDCNFLFSKFIFLNNCNLNSNTNDCYSIVNNITTEHHSDIRSKTLLDIINEKNLYDNKKSLKNEKFKSFGIFKFTDDLTKNSNERDYYYEISYRPFNFLHKHSINFIFSDVSELKRTEYIRAESKLKTNILGKIAHEFKTPIITIGAQLEELYEKLSEEEFVKSNNNSNITGSYININKSSLSEIKLISRRMISLSRYVSFLILDVINYSKTTTHKLTKSKNFKSTDNNNLEYNKLDLGINITSIYDIKGEILELGYNVLDSLVNYSPGNKSNISTIFNFDSNIMNYYIDTDIIKIKQILLNIISNSVKFTKKGKIIIESKLVTSNNSDYISISVYDTGRGLSAQELEKFNSNEEHDMDIKINNKDYNNSMGTGLGIGIIKSFCKYLDIKYYVSSKLSYWTKFNLFVKANKIIELEENSCFKKTIKNNNLNTDDNKSLNDESFTVLNKILVYPYKISESCKSSNLTYNNNSTINNNYNMYISFDEYFVKNNNNIYKNLKTCKSEKINMSNKRHRSSDCKLKNMLNKDLFIIDNIHLNNSNIGIDNIYSKSSNKNNKNVNIINNYNNNLNKTDIEIKSVKEVSLNNNSEPIVSKNYTIISEIDDNNVFNISNISNKCNIFQNNVCSYNKNNIDLIERKSSILKKPTKVKQDRNSTKHLLSLEKNIKFSPSINKTTNIIINNSNNNINNNYNLQHNYSNNLNNISNCIINTQNMYSSINKCDSSPTLSMSNIANSQNFLKSSLNNNISINNIDCNNIMRKHKILICDDTAMLVKSLNKMLISIPGIQENYDIVTGSDGIDILNLIKNDAEDKLIKLIITDENMEIMNGSEAVKIIKKLVLSGKLSSYYNLRFVSLTAFEDEYTKKQILDSGFDDIYSKPTSKETIKDFLNKHNLLCIN